MKWIAIAYFVSGFGTIDYFKTKEECLTQLTWYVTNNPNKVQEVGCYEIKQR